jgi:hypothetical protein
MREAHLNPVIIFSHRAISQIIVLFPSILPRFWSSCLKACHAKTTRQALQARNRPAQGGGRAAAETLGQEQGEEGPEGAKRVFVVA